MSTRRPSPLLDAHREAGGRELDDAGLPADFGDPEAEYRALTVESGLVDLCARDLLRATGKDHLSVLHAISTGVVEGLSPGSGALTVLTTPKGRVVDLVAVVRDEDAASLVLCGAGAGETVAAWVRRFVIMKDCALEPLGDRALLAVRGPGAADAVIRALGNPAPDPAWGVASPGDGVLLVRGGAPGEPGILVVTEARRAPEVWKALAEVAAPCGRTADLHARLAHRVPAHGREITQERNPWELRLDEVISMDKGCYVGQEVVARLVNYEKIRRRLALLETDAAPEHVRASPVRVAGKDAGPATSVSRLGTTTLALAFLPVDADESAVEVGDAPSAARVLDPLAGRAGP